MGSVAQSSPTFHRSCPEKAPGYLRLSKELDSDRSYHAEGVPHRAAASAYYGSASSFGSLGKNPAFSDRVLKVKGMYHGGPPWGPELPPIKFTEVLALVSMET